MTVVFALGYSLGPLLGAGSQRRPALRARPWPSRRCWSPSCAVWVARALPRNMRGPRVWPPGQGSRWGSPLRPRPEAIRRGIRCAALHRLRRSTGSSTRCSRPRIARGRSTGASIRASSTLRPSAFAARSALVDQAYLSQGITFDHGGREQPFPFDLLPAPYPRERVGAPRGRARAARPGPRPLRGGSLRRPPVDRRRRRPNALVSTCEGYVRAMAGVEPPLGGYVHVSGIDLVRDDDGTWRVLEDNLRCPSGLSYVIQNRAFMRRAFPEAFGDHHVEPVGHAPFLLLSALMAAAPGGTRVAPGGGPHPRAGERRLLRARLPGPADGRGPGGGARPDRARPARLPAHHRGPRAGGRDLPAHRRRLPRPGGPALRLAARRGRAHAGGAARAGSRCATPSGTGVADDKAIYAYVHDIIRYFLGEEPLLERCAPTCSSVRRTASTSSPTSTPWW